MKAFLALLILAGTSTAAWYLPARPRHHYSETGVVYTTGYLTLQVLTGVVGFPPGTQLNSRFDVHIPDEETVTDGRYTLAVDPQALTHDIEYAGELAAVDQLDQDQSQARLAQIKAAHAASQHSVELTHAQDIDGVNASMVAASTVGNYQSHLHDPTTIAGGWGGGYGSYGGGYGYASGGASVAGDSTIVTNVAIYNVGRGTGASPVAASFIARPVTGRAVMPQAPVFGHNVSSRQPVAPYNSVSGMGH